MTEDEDITPASFRQSDTDRTRRDLQAQVNTLTDVVSSLSTRLNALDNRLEVLENTEDNDPVEDQPAPWVLYTPPAAAEDRHHRDDEQSPLWTVENFVAWHNVTYVGLPGGSSRPIPPCWRHHPGLALEIATLAYTWRRANIGATANVRDAQYWHHQWRPGFAARLTDWVHSHCLDGRHRDSGAPARTDRFSTDTDTIPTGDNEAQQHNV
ncbi:hypothetical protein SAMN04487905_1244 [Actinopolyspora xinjiangensis]|uniref:DUF4913 domain-containing protein n=1 Tax=Actinopolyspora xinjiangensis TaxID=405564 RepID=A0A1H0X372_9ACTN|nr:hypothetical protein [Actinopolyspora xinjiangensis]SDP97175.1 hypothetical protein SAMN04487905_1244 [Actinopolyspora xinjiangensis]